MSRLDDTEEKKKLATLQQELELARALSGVKESDRARVESNLQIERARVALAESESKARAGSAPAAAVEADRARLEIAYLKSAEITAEAWDNYVKKAKEASDAVKEAAGRLRDTARSLVDARSGQADERAKLFNLLTPSAQEATRLNLLSRATKAVTASGLDQFSVQSALGIGIPGSSAPGYGLIESLNNLPIEQLISIVDQFQGLTNANDAVIKALNDNTAAQKELTKAQAKAVELKVYAPQTVTVDANVPTRYQ